MPYYIYKITSGEGPSARQLEFVSEHDTFKTAKQEVRSMRASLQANDDVIYKVMFAENQPEAEQKLLEHREQPVVKEWEK
jgi:hypothetical protein